MKLQAMANKSLKAMVKSYSDDGKSDFDIEYFRQLFPDESDEKISDALYVLRDDGFVTVFRADGIAYTTSLVPSGIRDCQESTLLKRGYQCLKEIKSLIS